MPYVRPDLSVIDQRIRADIAARLPGIDPGLERTVTRALARGLAGGVHGAYGNQAWIARQILPDTADAEVLDRHAAIRGLTRKPAALATGLLTVTGTDATFIPAGTRFRRADGLEYQSTADGTIAGGTVDLSIEAIETGAAGNAGAGTKLSFVSTIPGANSPGTVEAAGLTGGLDAESDDDLRQRVLEVWRAPAQGGSNSDYVRWAKETPGVAVSDVWVSGSEPSAGSVTLRILVGGATPQQADLDAVKVHIETLRPVTAQVFVEAPVEVALNVTIQDLTPDTTEVRGAVEAELADMIERERSPGVTILISHVREAISRAAGETDHVLIAPAANVTHNVDEIPVLGTVTYTSS